MHKQNKEFKQFKAFAKYFTWNYIKLSEHYEINCFKTCCTCGSVFKTINRVSELEIIKIKAYCWKNYIECRHLEHVQAQLKDPLKDMLSKRQLPFNESIKIYKEELENELLSVVDSVMLECEAKLEDEVSLVFYWN